MLRVITGIAIGAIFAEPLREAARKSSDWVSQKWKGDEDEEKIKANTI